MERTKKISFQTLAIAILSVLLLASVALSGAWFTSTQKDDGSEKTFGTIELGDINSALVFNLAETGGDVLMPGDSIDVDFDITNTGTAAMWVRFKLTISGDGVAAFDAALDTDAGLQTGYVYDTDDFYIYKTAVLENTAATEHQSFSFEIPTTVTDTHEGKDVSIALVVEAVQVAHNGDGESETYANAIWPAPAAMESNGF